MPVKGQFENKSAWMLHDF